jgi:hypothetical protein
VAQVVDAFGKTLDGTGVEIFFDTGASRLGTGMDDSSKFGLSADNDLLVDSLHSWAVTNKEEWPKVTGLKVEKKLGAGAEAQTFRVRAVFDNRHSPLLQPDRSQETVRFIFSGPDQSAVASSTSDASRALVQFLGAVSFASGVGRRVEEVLHMRRGAVQTLVDGQSHPFVGVEEVLALGGGDGMDAACGRLVDDPGDVGVVRVRAEAELADEVGDRLRGELPALF